MVLVTCALWPVGRLIPDLICDGGGGGRHGDAGRARAVAEGRVLPGGRGGAGVGGLVSAFLIWVRFVE